MRQATLITGNAHKAKHFSAIMQMDIPHIAIDIDELQSLDILEVVEHKAREAFKVLQSPVIVEDTKLEFAALGRLPGTFIKWFMEELGVEGLCELVDGKSRDATAGAAIAYFDGKDIQIFERSLSGEILGSPKVGGSGFGWNAIFKPKDSLVSFAEMSEEEFHHWYRQVKPFDELKAFLEQQEGVR